MTESPLHDFNISHGGRLVDFGGWNMPVQYDSVLSEHRAVRDSAGFFDVSHLGRFQLRGSGAEAAIDRLLCNNLEKIESGRAQYTMMLNEAGGVIDDIILWWWGDGQFWVMPNAVNQARVMNAFDQQHDCDVADLQMSTAMIAVQGPEAPDVLDRVIGETPGRFRTATIEWEGSEVRMAGTGYTGERGAELVTNADTAIRLAERFVEIGLRPCGLGARDTLRLEAGFPLWGQDLSEDTSPLEADLGFAVDFDHDFVGKAALEDQRSRGVRKKLTGFILNERGIPRHGYRVRTHDGAGEVTSGNMSPTLGEGIGMAYITPPLEDASPGLEVEIRGKWVPARVAKAPFHKNG